MRPRRGGPLQRGCLGFILASLSLFAPAALDAQFLVDPVPLPAARPFPPGCALLPLLVKLAPRDAELWLDGRRLETGAGPEGSLVLRLPPGESTLCIVAAGYETLRLALRAPSASLVEVKLERSPSPLRLRLSGATGKRPKSAQYTPDGRYLILPLLSGRGADVLDAESLAFIARLEPPERYAREEGFVESAFLPELREIWVSQMHTDSIHAFDLDTFAYKGSFSSGGICPKVIAISPDGSRAYVSNWVSENVALIDTRSRALITRVRTKTTPRGLAPSSDGAFLYIAGFGDGSILRLRLKGMALETFFPADGGSKRHLVLDEARGRLYATDMFRDSLFVFETATAKKLVEIRLGPNPNGCAASPDGSTIFTCTRGTNGSRGYELPGPDFGELIAVDAATLQVVARQWGGDQPTGLAVSPGGQRLVFTDFLDHRVEAYDILAR